MSRFYAEPILAPLKDFQRATVEHVTDRLYRSAQPSCAFLVADETGLGKSLVARGVIARAIEQLQDDDSVDDERLVPAQDRGLGFDVGPLLEPAVQALFLALLQVIPQAGQRAAGVQLRCRVEAGREVPGGRPLPRLDLADHVVRDGGPGG